MYPFGVDTCIFMNCHHYGVTDISTHFRFPIFLPLSQPLTTSVLLTPKVCLSEDVEGEHDISSLLLLGLLVRLRSCFQCSAWWLSAYACSGVHTEPGPNQGSHMYSMWSSLLTHVPMCGLFVMTSFPHTERHPSNGGPGQKSDPSSMLKRTPMHLWPLFVVVCYSWKNIWTIYRFGQFWVELL